MDHGIIVTNPSVDSGSGDIEEKKKPMEHEVGRLLSTSEEGGTYVHVERVEGVQLCQECETVAMNHDFHFINGRLYSKDLIVEHLKQ